VLLGAEYSATPDGRIRVTRAIDPFFNAAAGWGFIHLFPEQDLMVRRHLHVMPNPDADFCSSLAWETAQLIGSGLTKRSEERHTQRWVNYYGPPRALNGVSFRLALEPNENCPAGYFKGKVVFVSAYLRTLFSGQRKDELRNPYTKGDEFIPAVDAHATEFLNLVRGDWLKRFSTSLEIAVIALTGLVFGFGLARIQLWKATAIAVASIVTALALVQYLFLEYHLWFAWMIVVGIQVPVAWVNSALFNWDQLRWQKRLLEQSLALHLPPKRIKQFVRRPELLKPGAEKQLLSIMFTDISNFTAIAEKMDSDELAGMMNQYFERTISCIHNQDGTVVKLNGDSIFAIWNAPDQQPNHRELACRAALFLRNQTIQLAGGSADATLRTRIGLHTGIANVGNFGSATRVDYTVLGESVNLASRLEGLNKFLGTSILVSQETKEGIGERILTRSVGRFRLKGFEKVVDVFELIATDDAARATKAWRKSFEHALEAFASRDFESAELGFRSTLEIRPEDGPSKFYLQRIAAMRDRPPASYWSGETELMEK
jgi:adenylate cyclase